MPHSKTCALAIGLFGASLATVPAYAVAAPHPATTSCPPAAHTYIDALKATVVGSKVEVVAHPAKYHCGGPDDFSYKVSKKTITVTLKKASAVVKVFKSQEDPDSTITIKPAALVHRLVKNSAEPIYKIKGSDGNVTKMVERFHP